MNLPHDIMLLVNLLPHNIQVFVGFLLLFSFALEANSNDQKLALGFVVVFPLSLTELAATSQELTFSLSDYHGFLGFLFFRLHALSSVHFLHVSQSPQPPI